MNAILQVLMTLPVPAMVLFKLTILLGLGWVLHFALIRSNPRWRVLLWRMLMVGLVLLIPAQMFLPELPLFVIKEAQKISAPANPLPATPPAAPIELQTPAEPLVQPDHILPPIPQKSQVSIAAYLESLTRNWPALLAITWAALALILSIRQLYTYRRLSQFIKSANSAPESILATAKQIASQLERVELPQLRVADDLASPFAAGFLHPVIVIPKTLADEKYRPNLVAVLAHELVHIKSRDLFWMAFAHALSILLWFHPLMWRMRHAHNMACEQVCDGVAAEISGGAPAYSQTLAQTFLTLVVDAPQPMGAPMLRPSEITRRIAILKIGLQVKSLKWSWVGLACLAAIIVLAGLGGLRLAEREQQIRSWFAGYIHGADHGQKDDFSPSKLDWNDIPILLELAKSNEVLKVSEGNKIPCSYASSYKQQEGIAGMVALWLIERTRWRELSHWLELTQPVPPAEYGGMARCPFCLKYGRDMESCVKSEEIHQEALAAYIKWWQEVKSLPKAEAAKRDPLAHTDIPWYGRHSKYLRFRWIATESERVNADLFSPQDYSEKLWLLKDALFTESDIASAEAQPSAVADKYQILLRFNDDAGKRFAQVTEQNIGRQLAIVFKGDILMVPIIRAAIPDGRVVAGSRYKEQAEAIAKAITDLGAVDSIPARGIGTAPTTSSSAIATTLTQTQSVSESSTHASEDNADIDLELKKSELKWKKYRNSGGTLWNSEKWMKPPEYYKKLTTSDLLDECFSQPIFYLEMQIYDNPQLGIQRLNIMHNGFNEAFQRNDLWSGLLNYYQTFNISTSDSTQSIVSKTQTISQLSKLFVYLPILKKQIKGHENAIANAQFRSITPFVNYLDNTRRYDWNAVGLFYGEPVLIIDSALLLAQFDSKQALISKIAQLKAKYLAGKQDRDSLNDFLKEAIRLWKNEIPGFTPTTATASKPIPMQSFVASGTGNSISEMGIETNVSSSKHKNDRTIALLKEENIDQSLKLLSDVSLFTDPGIRGVYNPTTIIRFPIAIEKDRIDVEMILSNRRFLKIYQEFTDMSEHEAGRLLCREIDTILPIYSDLFNASWTQLMTGIKAAPPGMTRSVGPTLQTSDNADHSPTLLGARLKILSIALIAGNLNIASAKPGIKKIVEQAIQQREVYYKGDSQSEADRFCMLTGAGIYNRQILALAILGISGSTMDLEVRRLPTFDTPVTPYDSMSIWSDFAEPDYSKGEQKIKFPKPMDDQTFDKIVESLK